MFSARYCSNQISATRYGDLNLADCLQLCDQAPGCTAVQHDCGTGCWAMIDDVCGSETPTSCGSNIYYKAGFKMETSVGSAKQLASGCPF